MKQGIFASLIASALIAVPAFAQRMPELIVNHRDVPVATSSGRPVRAEQVKQAIVDAAARARLWTLAYEPNGTVLATRAWSDHVIVVAVTYSAERYSMAYRDSTNMKYAVNAANPNHIPARNAYPQPTGPVIHPFYNRYVKELKDAIGAELHKL